MTWSLAFDWGRLRKGVGRINFLSLLSVLGGTNACLYAHSHQAEWAWAVGTSLSALGPSLHVLASWMRGRELRDQRMALHMAELAALRAEVEALTGRPVSNAQPTPPVAAKTTR